MTDTNASEELDGDDIAVDLSQLRPGATPVDVDGDDAEYAYYAALMHLPTDTVRKG